MKLKTTADEAALSALPGVVGVVKEEGRPGFYDLTLAEGARGEAVLRACFARSLALESFDTSEPPLHDIFVSLVGEGARVADDRKDAA